ncbi:hypothetical protein M427DRAFT_31486 [Gonapodya prolifera JEL478]|uniref:Uncharacterized protein n=1 Tax=Gonapodya prolifera (strain JEL478) TaxID=1344416 RepID=A0A139AIS9_GONPJ|nr:hypothetical protein M427DRAFT_31486 [Gonapodya prolifera JEL478]|eukprot:KXS16353.1 hypothetical protein M427DRAFT_31486 [Gonapodya prolifera JEL478]
MLSPPLSSSKSSSVPALNRPAAGSASGHPTTMMPRSRSTALPSPPPAPSHPLVPQMILPDPRWMFSERIKRFSLTDMLVRSTGYASMRSNYSDVDVTSLEAAIDIWREKGAPGSPAVRKEWNDLYPIQHYEEAETVPITPSLTKSLISKPHTPLAPPPLPEPPTVASFPLFQPPPPPLAWDASVTNPRHRGTVHHTKRLRHVPLRTRRFAGDLQLVACGAVDMDEAEEVYEKEQKMVREWRKKERERMRVQRERMRRVVVEGKAKTTPPPRGGVQVLPLSSTTKALSAASPVPANLVKANAQPAFVVSRKHDGDLPPLPASSPKSGLPPYTSVTPNATPPIAPVVAVATPKADNTKGTHSSGQTAPTSEPLRKETPGNVALGDLTGASHSSPGPKVPKSSAPVERDADRGSKATGSPAISTKVDDAVPTFSASKVEEQRSQTMVLSSEAKRSPTSSNNHAEQAQSTKAFPAPQNGTTATDTPTPPTPQSTKPSPSLPSPDLNARMEPPVPPKDEVFTKSSGKLAASTDALETPSPKKSGSGELSKPKPGKASSPSESKDRKAGKTSLSKSLLNLAGFRSKKNKKDKDGSGDTGEEKEFVGTDWSALEKAAGGRGSGETERDGGLEGSGENDGGKVASIQSIQLVKNHAGGHVVQIGASSEAISKDASRNAVELIAPKTTDPAPPTSVTSVVMHHTEPAAAPEGPRPAEPANDLAAFLPKRAKPAGAGTHSAGDPRRPGEMVAKPVTSALPPARIALVSNGGPPVSLFSAGRRPSKVNDFVPNADTAGTVVEKPAESKHEHQNADPEPEMNGIEDGLAMLETLVSLKPLAGGPEPVKVEPKVERKEPPSPRSSLPSPTLTSAPPALHPDMDSPSSRRPSISRLLADLRAVDEHVTGQIESEVRKKREETDRAVGEMREKEKAWKGSAGLLNMVRTEGDKTSSGLAVKEEVEAEEKKPAVVPAMFTLAVPPISSASTAGSSGSPKSPTATQEAKVKREALVAEAMAFRGIHVASKSGDKLPDVETPPGKDKPVTAEPPKGPQEPVPITISAPQEDASVERIKSPTKVDSTENVPVTTRSRTPSLTNELPRRLSDANTSVLPSISVESIPKSDQKTEFTPPVKEQAASGESSFKVTASKFGSLINVKGKGKPDVNRPTTAQLGGKDDDSDSGSDDGASIKSALSKAGSMKFDPSELGVSLFGDTDVLLKGSHVKIRLDEQSLIVTPQKKGAKAVKHFPLAVRSIVKCEVEKKTYALLAAVVGSSPESMKIKKIRINFGTGRRAMDWIAELLDFLTRSRPNPVRNVVVFIEKQKGGGDGYESGFDKAKHTADKVFEKGIKPVLAAADAKIKIIDSPSKVRNAVSSSPSVLLPTTLLCLASEDTMMEVLRQYREQDASKVSYDRLTDTQAMDAALKALNGAPKTELFILDYDFSAVEVLPKGGKGFFGF